jgi:hypothetical protein
MSVGRLKQGPWGWGYLHLLAINYPAEPTQYEARLASARIRKFLTTLDCPRCRGHAVQHLAQHPPPLTDTYALQVWVWKFHNIVNLRLQKPYFSYTQYQQLYADELARAAAEWAPVKTLSPAALLLRNLARTALLLRGAGPLMPPAAGRRAETKSPPHNRRPDALSRDPQPRDLGSNLMVGRAKALPLRTELQQIYSWHPVPALLS